MSVATAPQSQPEHDDARAKRAVLVLIWAQSILGAQMPVHFILGSLAGRQLAPDPALATAPISAVVLATMFAAPAMSGIMGRWGRRAGFLLGGCSGLAGSALAVLAISIESFELYLVASLFLGGYMGAHGFYRFAATDLASPEFRPKAISWVMAGGLISAFIGPEIVKQFKDLLDPIPFAGAYLALTVVAIVGMVPILFLDIPHPPRAAKGTRYGRDWKVILADRTVVVAILCAMVAYALMNLVMTATPLAMDHHGFSIDESADVVRFHILAMFAPSFVTGALIARFGVHAVIAVGLIVLAGCAAVAITGITFWHFSIALILLGVGWNFAFIGATALLAGAHRSDERARVQGLNDFLVFGLVTVASFSAGALMETIGWEAVNYAMLPVLAIAAAALAWLVVRNRR